MTESERLEGLANLKDIRAQKAIILEHLVWYPRGELIVEMAESFAEAGRRDRKSPTRAQAESMVDAVLFTAMCITEARILVVFKQHGIDVE